MDTNKLLVIISGLGLIALIYWFFFGKKREVYEATNGEIEIIVKGGYKPEIIKLKKGKVVKLTFVRSDPSDCLEEVILPDFKIRKYLPLNEPVTIEIRPQDVGTYGLHCGMNMYHGRIIVS